MPPETVICRRCGVANTSGDQFCGSCGAFLEWEGDEAPPGGQEPSDPDEATVATPVAPEKPIETYVQPAPIIPPDAPNPVPATPDPTAGSASAAVPMPGFSVCPTCGSGNPPGRTFCHSCGNLLARDTTTAKGATGTERAGDEGKSRGIPGWLPLVLGAGLLVGVVVVLVTVVLRPSAPPSVAIPSATLTPTLGVPASVTPVPTLLASGAAPSGAAPSGASGEGVQLTASGATASSVAGDTPDVAAANVADGRLDTRWQEAEGSEPGEWIEVTFAPSRLDYVVVYSGFQLSHDSFVATRRPQNVAVSVNGGTPVGFLLQDSELPQRIDVADTPGATVVRILIASTYPATASAYPGSPIDAATISEIRIFGVAGG